MHSKQGPNKSCSIYCTVGDENKFDTLRLYEGFLVAARAVCYSWVPLLLSRNIVTPTRGVLSIRSRLIILIRYGHHKDVPGFSENVINEKTHTFTQCKPGGGNRQPLRVKLLQPTLPAINIAPMCKNVSLCSVEVQQHNEILALISVQITYAEKFARFIRLLLLLAEWNYRHQCCSAGEKLQRNWGYFSSSVTKCVMHYLCCNTHCAYSTWFPTFFCQMCPHSPVRWTQIPLHWHHLSRYKMFPSELILNWMSRTD